MARQQLVILAGKRLSNTPQLLSPETGPPRWGVSAFWFDVGGNPLRCSPESALNRPPREVREAGLPPDLVWYLMGLAFGGLLGELVGLLIAGNTGVGRDPEERDLIASANDP